MKSDISKEILEESEIFAKQTGNVKKLVTSYKRLSVPCFLSQDEAWNIEKPVKIFFSRIVVKELTSINFKLTSNWIIFTNENHLVTERGTYLEQLNLFFYNFIFCVIDIF